ncbi:hypothetical protein L332_07620 [Agrococcus pavilionensis RW1]|uniref:DUF2087 domain-containing protein n=1 Tax=Agrococcus pavilionensis RW1 TaxID=1330458 RepID=U1MQY2_9MICO|nr:DUF2087 domain-containing protein [Agrococcus pavilionensis]ERG64321.1 hypothetical protein L332_07620 [Agrococcus pavilionensis RW1]
MTDAWRPIAAALADEGRRLAWARIVLGVADRSPVQASALTARERRAVEALERAGLVTVVDGAVLPADPFTPLLGHRPAASGIDRFVRDGRIAAWPKRPADRAALLRWATEHALPAGGSASEAAVTERLAAIIDDPATLRRYLVDAGLLEREADGSAYRRP